MNHQHHHPIQRCNSGLSTAVGLLLLLIVIIIGLVSVAYCFTGRSEEECQYDDNLLV